MTSTSDQTDISNQPVVSNQTDVSHRDPGQPTAGDPVFPEAILVVRSWPDTVLDELGHDPRSNYAERYWVSVIGPSCYLALRRFAEQLDRHPQGFEIATRDLALELGLGAKGGRHGPMWRAIERACHFGRAHRQGPLLAVRRRFPPLSGRQLRRMPEHLVAAHTQWQTERLSVAKRRTVALPHESLQALPPLLAKPGDRAA